MTSKFFIFSLAFLSLTNSTVFAHTHLTQQQTVQKKLLKPSSQNFLTYDDWEHEDYHKYFGKLPGNKTDRETWFSLPSGVDPDGNKDDPIAITLTSYPKRTEPGTAWRVWVTIESLMRQTVKPQRIILFLASQQYPHREYDLPRSLVDLKKRGLEIIFVKHDDRPAKKLLPALTRCKGMNIVVVDDDMIYAPTMLEELYTVHKKHPKTIVAHRSKKVSLDPLSKRVKTYMRWQSAKAHSASATSYVSEGCGGILYPREGAGYNGLHPVILNRSFKQIYLTNDDHWSWLCSVLAGTKTYALRNWKSAQPWEDFIPEQTLWFGSNLNGGNDLVMCTILQLFPEIRAKLGADEASYKLQKRRPGYLHWLLKLAQKVGLL